MSAFPERVESFRETTRPGGPLAGWRLSHGSVVLAGAGSVALDNIQMQLPLPPILLYAPSPSISPAQWLDFDKEDGPYRLAGFAYFAPYQPGSTPPQLPCIRSDEWMIHEAGWHLMDGGMRLTPDAATETPRPPDAGDVPTISMHNPNARPGGLCLPKGSFYRLVNGSKKPVPMPAYCHKH